MSTHMHAPSIEQDKKYHHLLVSRPLDPASAKHLNELRTQYQYVDACIRDADLKLDAEWEDYQRKKNNNKSVLAVPWSGF